MTEPRRELPDAPDGPLADTARSATMVAAGILLSRLAGLVREMTMAAFLATTPAADAFRAAFRIPNLLQNLLGEGALSAAFIPVYAKLLAEGRRDEASKVAGAIGGLLAATTGVVVVVVVVAAEPITALLAPGFTGATYDLTVQLVRIMTAGVGMLVLSAWCLGILNTHRRFFLAYAAPVVWNATQVAVLVTVGLRGWSEASLAEALAWGVLVGGVLQFLIQLPAVMRLEPGLRPSLQASLPDVRTVLRRFGPAVLGRGVVQVLAYIDLVLASLLASGAVAALGYAQILYLLPISLFAMSISAAELPELSRSDDDLGQVERLDVGLRRILFFIVFTVVAYLLAGRLIVEALFQRRLFDADDTLLVWLVLCGFSVGLVAVTSSRLLQNALFARGDTKGPAWISAVRVALAAVLGVVLMFQFDQFAVIDAHIVQLGDLPAALRPLPDAVRNDGVVRLGAVGLSLAAGLTSWVELALLRARVRRTLGASPALAAPLARLAPAALSAAVVLVGTPLVTDWLPGVIQALVTVGAGGLAYVAVAQVTGVAEARTALASLVRRTR